MVQKTIKVASLLRPAFMLKNPVTDNWTHTKLVDLVSNEMPIDEVDGTFIMYHQDGKDIIVKPNDTISYE